MNVVIIGGERFEGIATSKKMKNNANVFFPRNSLKVLDILDNYAKHKALNADNIKTVLDFLRSSSEEEVHKFAQSKSSHKVIEACLNIAKARKIGDVLDAIVALKIPVSMLRKPSSNTNSNTPRDTSNKELQKIKSFLDLKRLIFNARTPQLAYVYVYKFVTGLDILANDLRAAKASPEGIELLTVDKSIIITKSQSGIHIDIKTANKHDRSYKKLEFAEFLNVLSNAILER